MLKLAICDDLPQERAALRRFLAGYFAGAGYEYRITEYICGEALAADYEDGDADYNLIFLDIFMGGLNGIETAQKIRAYSESVSIIFLTTSPDFALEGYDVRARGYLLKPLVPEKAAAQLDRFLREESVEAQKSLLIREGTRGVRIPCREILYLESQGNLLLIHTKTQTLRTRRTIAEVETELSALDFLRCHHSFLVNLEQVEAAEKTEFIMTNGAHIPMRQRETKSLRDIYFTYLLGKEPPPSL